MRSAARRGACKSVGLRRIIAEIATKSKPQQNPPPSSMIASSLRTTSAMAGRCRGSNLMQCRKTVELACQCFASLLLTSLLGATATHAS